MHDIIVVLPAQLNFKCSSGPFGWQLILRMKVHQFHGVCTVSILRSSAMSKNHLFTIKSIELTERHYELCCLTSLSTASIFAPATSATLRPLTKYMNVGTARTLITSGRF